MKRIQPVGKSDACLENSDPTLEDSGFFGTPGARSQWDWSEDRRVSGSKELHLWQTPARYIRNKWKGRASFVEDESSPWMRKLGPQHVLKGLIVLVILASLGFAVLTYSRHVRGAVPGAVNGKYKSIEFGRVKRSAQLEEDGKLIKDIVDDELGGNNAALQFGFDIKKNGTGNGLNEINKDDLESLLELEAQLNEIGDLLEGNLLDSELIIKREAQTEGQSPEKGWNLGTGFLGRFTVKLESFFSLKNNRKESKTGRKEYGKSKDWKKGKGRKIENGKMKKGKK